ncbi:hypothetical protein KIPB_002723 [Kipferlia bialata]|uniref:Uncharacterized protein n=1 Tax=Kipferlia bialata TaxID=797122 RepID=A0A9K3GF60_9EUKA|nr:hypothetical protein KIPB_002723 [Kipferlia bialata]|eukprot:g2723.t1
MVEGIGCQYIRIPGLGTLLVVLHACGFSVYSYDGTSEVLSQSLPELSSLLATPSDANVDGANPAEEEEIRIRDRPPAALCVSVVSAASISPSSPLSPTASCHSPTLGVRDREREQGRDRGFRPSLVAIGDTHGRVLLFEVRPQWVLLSVETVSADATPVIGVRRLPLLDDDEASLPCLAVALAQGDSPFVPFLMSISAQEGSFLSPAPLSLPKGDQPEVALPERTVAIEVSGSCVAVGSCDGTVGLYSGCTLGGDGGVVCSETCRYGVGSPRGISAMCLSASGDCLYCTSFDGVVASLHIPSREVNALEVRDCNFVGVCSESAAKDKASTEAYAVVYSSPILVFLE